MPRSSSPRCLDFSGHVESAVLQRATRFRGRPAARISPDQFLGVSRIVHRRRIGVGVCPSGVMVFAGRRASGRPLPCGAWRVPSGRWWAAVRWWAWPCRWCSVSRPRRRSFSHSDTGCKPGPSTWRDGSTTCGRGKFAAAYDLLLHVAGPIRLPSPTKTRRRPRPQSSRPKCNSLPSGSRSTGCWPWASRPGPSARGRHFPRRAGTRYGAAVLHRPLSGRDVLHPLAVQITVERRFEPSGERLADRKCYRLSILIGSARSRSLLLRIRIPPTRAQIAKNATLIVGCKTSSDIDGSPN